MIAVFNEVLLLKNVFAFFYYIFMTFNFYFLQISAVYLF